MARRSASLKPHLNQIRTWVAEGVTDIWIAHQLDSTPASIAAFRRRHGLTRPSTSSANPAVAAAGLATAAPLAGEPDEMITEEATTDDAVEVEDGAPTADAADGGGTPARKRRRGRRGGRGRGRRRAVSATIALDGDDLVVRLSGIGPDVRAAWDGRTDVTVEVDAGSIAVRETDEGQGEGEA